MPIRIYLAPITQIERGLRVFNASRCLLYPISGGTSAIMPDPHKAWCLTWVDATDEEHTTIAADPTIRPLGTALVLDTLYSDLGQGVRTAIETAAENNRVPMDWIGPATTVRDVVRHIIRLLLCVQLLQADFPEVDLDLTFNTIGAAQRNRILTWCTNNGISTTGLTNSTPIRAILRALIVRYPNWTTHQLGTWEV